MGDFSWRPLVKKVGLASGTTPLPVVVPTTREGSHPSSLQDLPPTSSAIQASTPNAATIVVASTSPPPSVVFVQEVAPTAEVSAPIALVGPVVAPSSTVVASLLSASVMTASAPKISPPPSLALPVPLSAVLASPSPSTSSHPPCFFRSHLHLLRC
ncbi:mucin-7-like [Glycine soja]|uniref:mucin-7-like n=1 Tax=Glycine soja TaxID=3848 RepID=UPI001038C1D3|nr:mucin-7-like [Glycine soja]